MLLDLHHPFEIDMDTSSYDLGALITQSSHSVAFHSEIFNDTVERYSTYEKELYSIVKSIKQWRHYILGKDTIIVTDHKPL